jgi:hypothetical protein
LETTFGANLVFEAFAADALGADFGATFAAGFLTTGFLATGFFAASFVTAAFFAAGFFATGFFAAGFFAAGFFAAGFPASAAFAADFADLTVGFLAAAVLGTAFALGLAVILAFAIAYSQFY